jgi:hypothetical protein
MKKYIFLVYIIQSISLVFAFQGPWHILGYESRGKYPMRIVFLENNIQQKFVLKCYGDDQKEEAICEDLGSFIGCSVEIPVHTTQIIQKGPLLAEINNGTSLATLHVCVPGRELCKWFEDPAYNIVLRGGLISERHLNTLCLSDDLCDIVVLDIFLSNRDRHYENCFVDEVTMRYYGIDMGDSFLDIQRFPNIEKEFSVDKDEIIIPESKILAFNAYNFLCTLQPKHFSWEQIRTLKRIKSKLQYLLSLYSADTIFELWISKAQEIGYTYTDYKKRYIKAFLVCNTYWLEQIIDVINQLVP